MQYLNLKCIEAVSSDGFRKQEPYPWVQMQDTLTQDGWSALRATLPNIADFRRMIGVKRAHGQAPHNRGILHYLDGMTVAQPWKEFIAELNGPAYASFIRRAACRRRS